MKGIKSRRDDILLTVGEAKRNLRRKGSIAAPKSRRDDILLTVGEAKRNLRMKGSIVAPKSRRDGT